MVSVVQLARSGLSSNTILVDGTIQQKLRLLLEDERFNCGDGSVCEIQIPPPPHQSLPAAFLAAGYGGASSTLWEVEDVSTAVLMLQFYWQWRHEQRVPSLALARAQHWQRHD